MTADINSMQSDRIRLDDRVILVTGAGSGIGRASSQLLAQRGAKVLVTDVNEQGGNETVALIESAGGQASFLRADVSKEDDVKAMVAEAVRRFGGLHGALNNAAVESNTFAPVHEEPLEQWNRLVAVNQTGVFLCIKYQAAHMLKNGGGSIVNIASVAGMTAIPNLASYVATKHAVVGLTRAASCDYAALGIRVNAIAPGAIETPMLRDAFEDPEAKEHILRMHPIGRIGQPWNIAEGVAWLLSDASAFVTGVCLPIDGGYTSI